MSGGANLQRNLEFCGGSKKMQGNSGAFDWDAHDWECQLCFFLGPNPWWLGSKKKKITCNVGDKGSIPGLGRCPGRGRGNPLQYPCLGNSRDRGGWRATVHGAARAGHDLATKPPPLVSGPGHETWGSLRKSYFCHLEFSRND